MQTRKVIERMETSFTLASELVEDLERFTGKDQYELELALRAGFSILLHLFQKYNDVGMLPPGSSTVIRTIPDDQGWSFTFTDELTVKQLFDELRKASTTGKRAEAELSENIFFL